MRHWTSRADCCTNTSAELPEESSTQIPLYTSYCVVRMTTLRVGTLRPDDG